MFLSLLFVGDTMSIIVMNIPPHVRSCENAPSQQETAQRFLSPQDGTKQTLNERLRQLYILPI